MDGMIFDLNNCLVCRPDIPLAISQAIKRTVSEAGYEFRVPEKYLTDSWLTERGKNRRLLFWNFLHLCKVEVKYRDELASRAEELYRDYKDYAMVTPYQDTVHLSEIKIPKGLITNSSPTTTEKILSKTGLKFDHVFADGGKENLMESAKEKMGNVTFIGDSTEDICLGRRHELKTIAINRGIVPLNRLLRAQPDLILNSLAPLPYLSNLDSKPEN